MELQPLLDSLKQKIKESEKNFDEFNQKLEEFFKKSLSEYSEYSTLLSQINEKVNKIIIFLNLLSMFNLGHLCPG